MQDVWIQLEGEEEPFTVEVKEDCFVDKLRDAILRKCPDIAVSSRKLVVYVNKETYERRQRGEEGAIPMKPSEKIRMLGLTYTEALFVTVFHEPSPPSSPSAGEGIFMTNGIDPSQPHLSRDQLTERILSSNARILLIASAAGSGKTSLLYLLREKYPSYKFIRLLFLPNANPYDLLISAGIDLMNEVVDSKILNFQKKYKHIIFFIDDAQNLYENESFWFNLTKSGWHPENIRFIIAATYALPHKIQASPLTFVGLSKIGLESLKLTEEESMQFMFLKGKFPNDWKKYKSLIHIIISECDGLIAALNISVEHLSGAKEVGYNAMEQDELSLIRRFFSKGLLGLMKRCFAGFDTNLSKESKEILLDAILHPSTLANLGSGEEFIQNVALTDLIRMGIMLPVNGDVGDVGTRYKFSSPLASRFYTQQVYGTMAISNPPSIKALLLQVLATFSSKYLNENKDNKRNFPKEAVIQHAFFKGLQVSLTATTAICPELSNVFGNPSQGISGEIDFVINSDLNWGLELLVCGDAVQSHLNRFEPNGPYHALGLNDYAIIDFRHETGSSLAKIQKHERRITVLFSPDYKEAKCLFFKEKNPVTVNLSA